MPPTARERAVGLGYAAGWGVVRALPAGVAGRAFRAGAHLAMVRNGAGTRQLRRNLRRVVGPEVSELRLDELVGEGLRSYARYWMETFRLESIDRRALVAAFDADMIGREHLDAAHGRGNGVVLALTHSGNWEASGIWLAHHYGKFTTVAERLKPDSLFERFLAYRESLGMEVLPLTGGARPPFAVLAERLAAGGVICLLADRDLSHNGMDVNFFGETARMPPGPALLAARTGASLHAVHSYFAGDRWGHTVGVPIEVPARRLREQVALGTQLLADQFSGFIAQRPADWHMLQPLWSADLPARPPRPASAER